MEIIAEKGTKIKENFYKGRILFSTRRKAIKITPEKEETLNIVEIPYPILDIQGNLKRVIKENNLVFIVANDNSPVHIKIWDKGYKGLVVKEGNIYQAPAEHYLYTILSEKPPKEANCQMEETIKTPEEESLELFKRIKGQVYTIWLPKNIDIRKGIMGYPVQKYREITFTPSEEYISFIVKHDLIYEEDVIDDKHFSIASFPKNKKGEKKTKDGRRLAFDGKKLWLI
ncbi:MAG: hypothetical protein QW067_03215 [Thermofilaceae archaeon]